MSAAHSDLHHDDAKAADLSLGWNPLESSLSTLDPEEQSTGFSVTTRISTAPAPKPILHSVHCCA